MEPSRVILSPVLTEKSNRIQGDRFKKYTFKVHPKANKLQIKEAVSELFSVKAVTCRVFNKRGKRKSNVPVSAKSFKRGFGFQSSWKKAIVTLAENQKIALFENG